MFRKKIEAMTQKANFSLKILFMVAALGACHGAHAQNCVLYTFDQFSDEGMGIPICGTPHVLITENWHNLVDDETDWIPWAGPTPTGHTGPYGLPELDFAIMDGPTFFDGFSDGLRMVQRNSAEERQFDPGTYLYIESSDCCSNRAILESDTLDFSDQDRVAFIFWYHMFGSNMGSLAMDISLDGGENWETTWEEPDPTTGWTSSNGAGTQWRLGGANLTDQCAGQSQVLIRLTGTVSPGGERSDIAIDNLIVYSDKEYPIIHNEGTFEYEEIPSECRFRATFDKPSDLCPSVDQTVDQAELRLSLNMGDIYRYGGTDFDGGVTITYTIGLQESDGPGFETSETIMHTLPDGDETLYSGPHTLSIADSEHPEQLAIHDFTEFYEDVSFIDVWISSLEVGENPDFPVYLDDVQLDVEVDIVEHIDARKKTVDLTSPSTLSGSGFTHFAWTPSSGSGCAFPLYRFQLLRLHDFADSDATTVISTMDDDTWDMSALTLEVGDAEVDLTMMEGTGYYAWRVMPIGNLFPGGAGNDLNWGDYSAFDSSVSLTNPNPQTINNAVAAANAGIFFYDDQDDDKNRSFTRAFSRNLTDEGEELLVKESVGFSSGSGFPQQTQTISRGQEVTLAMGSVRSHKGRTPLSILPVPIEKQDLHYQPALLLNEDNEEYTAADFDSELLFRNPSAMSTSEGAATPSPGQYWSDTNEDLRIPSAEGYPFSAVEYSRDGTNRPLTQGFMGHVRRLKPDGYTTRIKYGSVTREELIRIFGNEAPNPKKVEKVITISPEQVTTVTYIDLMGRILATCLASNPLVDSDKIDILTPEDGFEVVNELDARSAGNPYLYEAQTEITLEEEMTLELDLTLEGAAFQSACNTFCRTCDYKVTFQIVDLDATTAATMRVFEDSVTVSPEPCAGGVTLSLPDTEWDNQVQLDAGRYMVHYEIRLNNTIGTSTYLDNARESLATATEGDIDDITDPLLDVLNDIIDEEGSIADFYLYCDDLAAEDDAVSAVDEDGNGSIDYYVFELGESGLGSGGFGACEQIRIDADTCKYDCNPETRDFESFVTEVATASLRAFMEPGRTALNISETLDLDPYCPGTSSSPGCFDLTDARGWVPRTGAHAGASLDWDNPNNVAALNYDVNEGEFNQVIENMLAEYEEDPVRYETYSCLSLYSNLEAISTDLFYYTRDSSIVEQLLGRVGRHFETEHTNAGTFGVTQGWKTHPYKIVKRSATDDPECDDANSTFSQYDVDNLDPDIESQRDSIEDAYYMLWSCLNTDEAAASGAVADSPSGAINEENIYRRWRENCEDLMAQKEDYFESQAGEAVDAAYAPDGYLYDPALSSAVIEEYKACYTAAIMAYVQDMCFVPDPPKINIGTSLDDPSPTFFHGPYQVDDTGADGFFVRHGGSEWAEFSRNGPDFVTTYTKAYDEVAPGSAGGNSLEVKRINYEIEAPLPDSYLDLIPTEEDMDILTSIAMGSANFFFHPDSVGEETLDITAQGASALVPTTVLFEDDFAYTPSSNCPSLPGALPDCSSNWRVTHNAGGTRMPRLVDRGMNSVLALRCGRENSTATRVIGNGAWYEGAIVLNAPSNQYELDLDLDFIEGNSIDNLYVVLDNILLHPGGPSFIPELPGNHEVLYPTEPLGRRVAVHLKTVPDENGGWKNVSSRFVIPNPGNYRLHVYIKQELDSDPVRVHIDNIRIRELTPCTIPASLYGDFEVWTPEPDTLHIESCDQIVARGLREQILGEKERILDVYDSTLVSNYVRHCAPEDAFEARYSLNYYQYTLYYYDPLGRLIKTVAPKGVDTTSVTRSQAPSHEFVTEYAYNGLGNLVKTSTPDGGTRHTWYDRLQRVRFSQTAEDVAQNRFRYLCYDGMDRLVRSGIREFQLGSAETLSDRVDDLDWPEDDGDPTTTLDCQGCSERKYIIYDTPMDPIPSGFSQENLTNRISYVRNEEGDITAYSYDARGQIKRLYQHVDLSAHSIPDFDNIIEYEFDPSSGMEQVVSINPGREDQFFHRFQYDADQNLTTASSSTDKVVWHQDVHYDYYPGGDIRRVSLGHYDVQGVDYTYNINGQIIGINLPTESSEEEPGQDGHASGPHPWTAPDAFAQQFHYYSGDFSRPDSPFTQGDSKIEADDYFDGNLSGLSWMQRSLSDVLDDELVVGRRFIVDELSRLHDTDFSQLTPGGWSESSAHHSTYAYDANGNLTDLSRTDEDGTTFDNLSYVYDSGQNRLNHVTDDATSAGDDIQSQPENNYEYDSDGRLLKDISEGISSFEWRATDKVDQVTLDDGSTIRYRYDANGNRVAKITEDKTTLYLRSSNGQNIAIYDYPSTGTITLEEHSLYNGRFIPSSQLTTSALSTTPTYKRHLGCRQHTISDHVSNVRAVVSDLAQATDAGDGTVAGVSSVIVASMDYAPFGSLVTSRSSNPSNYRYAFNGKEQENDIKVGTGIHYDLGTRHYDPRIGRMLSIDPRAQEYPWQSPYVYHGNQPHFSVDYNGGGEDDWWYSTKGQELWDGFTETAWTIADQKALDVTETIENFDVSQVSMEDVARAALNMIDPDVLIDEFVEGGKQLGQGAGLVYVGSTQGDGGMIASGAAEMLDGALKVPNPLTAARKVAKVGKALTSIPTPPKSIAKKAPKPPAPALAKAADPPPPAITPPTGITATPEKKWLTAKSGKKYWLDENGHRRYEGSEYRAVNEKGHPQKTVSSDLSRPSWRKAQIERILAPYGGVKTPGFDFGHIFGWENRRVILAATYLKWTQPQLNDYVNSPRFANKVVLEWAPDNRSRKYEMPGNDNIERIVIDMRQHEKAIQH